MPEASFQHRAVTPAEPGHVWARLQDPQIWATVAGVDDTSDHAHDGPLLIGFRFATSIAGVTYRGTARVTEARREEAMTLGIRSSELTGAIGVVLGTSPTGTALDVTMRMRPAGIMGTLVFPVVTSAVSNGFVESVENLAIQIG
ncbi:MAG TPA: hypothetical protein VLB85_09910 [Acidimicrobiia bacterium]|nr:hypothetical protein [Acidimicrobiia bacterium]